MRSLVLLLLAVRAFGQILWEPPRASTVQPPKPPFTYLREDPSGTQPKLFARDAAGATWNVKFGYEIHNESFCWRVVEACGYFAEPSFFVGEGALEGYKPLQRATSSVQPDGHFTAGRFQYRDPDLKFLADRNWRWDRPPFAGTKELSGLKILIMLFSNWDNKDGRAGPGGGPNTAEFEYHGKRLAAFTDWGSGMGRWGSKPGTDSNWNCADYTAQTPGFAKRVGPWVVFSWSGVINQGFKTGITPAHVAWLMQYLGKVTDGQLHDWLKAAGGNDTEAACFTSAIRNRIEQLRKAAGR